MPDGGHPQIPIPQPTARILRSNPASAALFTIRVIRLARNTGSLVISARSAIREGVDGRPPTVAPCPPFQPLWSSAVDLDALMARSATSRLWLGRRARHIAGLIHRRLPPRCGALAKGEGRAGPQAGDEKDPRTLPSDAACHSLIAPLLGRWRVESGAARQLGLPARCGDG